MKARIIAVAIAAVFVTACTSNEPKPSPEYQQQTKQVTATLGSIPAWYEQAGKDGQYYYTSGTAVSTDLAMSMSKAKLDAQAKVAEHIRADVDSFTRQHQLDENDVASNRTEILIQKLVADVQLSRGVVSNRVVLQEGNKFRTYVQLRFPAPNIERAIQSVNGYEGASPRERAMERDLEQLKQDKRRRDADRSAAVVSPIASVEARPLPDNSGIVIRETRAAPDSKPLGVADASEER